jgi:hypothetical protein
MNNYGTAAEILKLKTNLGGTGTTSGRLEMCGGLYHAAPAAATYQRMGDANLYCASEMRREGSQRWNLWITTFIV